MKSVSLAKQRLSADPARSRAKGDVIHFEQVSKRYPDSHAGLSEIDLSLRQGEMAFLTGHSGAGKSTLLKLIGLLERPSGGQLRVLGRYLNRLAPRQVAAHRREIGMIFQDNRLLFDRNVFDNVALPLVIRGMAPREIARRVRAALDKTGLLHKERALPVTLSGGEQQRVGIARAVVAKPPLILADEPTGNLDPGLSRDIMALLDEFNQVGVTVLIASHDIELISTLGKRILVLEEGRLVYDTANPEGRHD